MLYPCPACGPVEDVLHGEDGSFHCLTCDREVAPLLGGLLQAGRGRWRRSPARGRRGRGELELLCESCGEEATTEGKPWCGDCLLAGSSPYVAQLLERIATHECPWDDPDCWKQCKPARAGAAAGAG